MLTLTRVFECALLKIRKPKLSAYAQHLRNIELMHVPTSDNIILGERSTL